MSMNHKKEIEPSSAEIASAAQGISRRLFTRVLAIMGISYVADNVSQGALSAKVLEFLGGNSPEGDKMLNAEGVAEKLEEAAQKVAKSVKESGEATDQLAIMRKTIDYLGTGLFVQGVLQLIFVKENNHINAYQFAALGVLSGLKYQLSDEEDRHHLIKETEGAIKTFGLIAGAMTVGEGVNADIVRAWEKAKGEKPVPRDLIAIMTTLSAGVSTTATTLVNAPVVRNMALDLAKTDKMDKDGRPVLDEDVMAICTGHNANVAGIAGFGNPPFMAVCEKFGFEEGMKWKLKTMLPLALYSWASSTFKLNLVMAKRAGLTGVTAMKKAAEDTRVGLTKPENISFFAKTIFESLKNAAKYFVQLKGIDAQSEAGIRFQIGEVIGKKLKGLLVLPFAKEVGHGYEGEGLVHGMDLEIQGADTIAESFFGALSTTSPDGANSVNDEPDSANALHEAIVQRNYEEIVRIGKQMGVSNIEILVENLRDFHDDKKINESVDKPMQWKEAFSPIRILDRATDVNRIKGVVGHNLADVMNVFPFQAGCVPFLVPVFKDAIAALEAQGLKGATKEITLFFLIQFFSSVADNYVACKIGLELLPDKPEIALIASENPWHNPISNMSNLAQFSLDEFSLKAAIGKAGWHVDSTVVALAYSQALGIFTRMGFVTPPKAAEKKGHATHEVEPESVDKNKVFMSRRRIFSRILS